MEYAQLNEALTEAIQITTHGNVAWDDNNYCTAEALVKDGLADQFRVVPLTVVAQPQIDPLTQTVMRDGCELINGEWRYKWRIDQLTTEQIASVAETNRVAAIPSAVTARQIRMALTQAGLRASVEAAVAAGDQNMQDWYAYSNLFERYNPLVIAMGTTLGQTTRQLDDLWTLANTL